jgi:hypothetical protein
MVLLTVAGCGGDLAARPQRGTSDGGSDDAPFAPQGTGDGSHAGSGQGSGSQSRGPQSGSDAASSGQEANDAAGVSSGSGSFPACAWSTPATPDAGSWPVNVGTARTVVVCGVGNVNNEVCLSSSASECVVPEGVYGADGPCLGSQCLPCTAQCAPNEYAIGVGTGITEGPEVPVMLLPTLPSNCRMNVCGGFTPFVSPQGVPGYAWTYSCCPCE